MVIMVEGSSRAGRRGIAALFLLLAAAVQPLSAFQTVLTACSGEMNVQEVLLDITCRSGFPLLLELQLTEVPPECSVLVCESGQTRSEAILPLQEDAVLLYTPAYTPGREDVTVTLRGENGEALFQGGFEFGSAEFVWGRDNFSYSNVENPLWGITPYSRLLSSWAEERFGPLEPAQHILLLDSAYRLFSGRIGRCYAFTGTKALYLARPELLPSPYGSLYEVKETDTAFQRSMNLLQNDMMFSRFVVTGQPLPLTQTNAELHLEFDRIRSAIALGAPAVIGYLAPERHHSLLVYGYLSDPHRERASLITANNWGTGHDENRASDAAVEISIRFDGGESQRIRWVSPPNRAYSFAASLFTVEVPLTPAYDRKALDVLLETGEEQLLAEGGVLIIAEECSELYLIDSEARKAGSRNQSLFQEIPGSTVRTVDNVRIIRLADSAAVELYARSTASKSSEASAVFILYRTGFPEDPRLAAEIFAGEDFSPEGVFEAYISSEGITPAEDPPAASP
jgi:hypothetical protein